MQNWKVGMMTEAEIRMQGMELLVNHLGLVEAERFMVLASRERFNYTEWRQKFLPDYSLEELASKANEYAKRHISS